MEKKINRGKTTKQIKGGVTLETEYLKNKRNKVQQFYREEKRVFFTIRNIYLMVKCYSKRTFYLYCH